MKDDAELLADYVAHRSEAAFTALVQRHLGLVHAVALRRLGGDAQLAEDVAQRVFTDLARKAPSLTSARSVSGWLYASTLVASAAAVRAEQRRKTRETTAHAMQTLQAEIPADWEKLRPLLDTTIVTLRDEDRDAIVMRFLQQRSFAEVGAVLHVSEEAARKRVDRALEKLRDLLARQGITSTSGALALTLGAAAAIAVAPALTTRIAGAALAEAAVPVTTAATTAAGLLHAAWPAAAILSVGAFFAHDQRGANQALRNELASLQPAGAEIDRLRAERRRLVDAARDARDLRRVAADRAAQAAARSEPNAPASPITADRMADLTVSPDGRLAWGGTLVSLGDFIRKLKDLRRPGEPGTCALVIHAPGTTFSALAYAIDEARKAGLDHVVVHSDTPANPKLGFSWF